MVGGSGFVGKHIHTGLSASYQVIVSGRDVDVRNAALIKKLISDAKPDRIIHLAAITTLGESFGNARETYDINFGGTVNLLMALRESRFNGRFLYVSSSEVYGLLSEHELPVSEARLLKPLSPYAVSKIAAEALCYQWSQTGSFEIVLGRPFNHIGPGQSQRFAISEFARQIAAIKLGLSEPVMHVGDIETTRDFTDVRDVVVAYQRLLEDGRNGEIYNVCSGTERSMRSLITRMCELAEVDVELRPDALRFRRSEQRRVFGSNARLVAKTGWQPRFSLEQTLLDILEFWDRRLRT